MAANGTDDGPTLQSVTSFFGQYVILAVAILGVLGNSLSCLVFFKRRGADRTSAQYLGLLALVDLVNLALYACIVVHNLVQGHQTYDVAMLYNTDLACQVHLYTLDVLTTYSGFIIVLFTIERLLVIWYPLKMAPHVSSNRPRRTALIALLVFLALLFATDFHFIGNNPITESGDYRVCMVNPELPDWQQNVYTFDAFYLVYAVPCALIFIMNTLIVVGLRKNRMIGKSKKETDKVEARCSRNLIMVSVVFFVFMTPAAVCYPFYIHMEAKGFPGYSDSEISDISAAAEFTWVLTYINFAANPLLYTVGLPFYKAECRRILCCCFGNGDQSSKNSAQKT